MTENLKDKAINGVFWRGLQVAGSKVVQLGVSIVLARLLLPEEFGMVAILMIFISIAQVFIDSGFGTALIQKKDTDFVDECTVFYISMFVALISYILLYFTAPWIAEYYNNLQLKSVLRVMALILLINAFSQVQATLLIRELEFKQQFKINFFCIIISGITGLTMAYGNFGVWALVGQQIAMSLSKAVLYYVGSSWRPKLTFCYKSLSTLFRFGSKLLLSGLLDRIFSNIYGLVIGKVYSSASLGYYNNGRMLPSAMSATISGVIASVSFPVFSKLQHDLPKLKLAVKRFMVLIMIIIFPAMFGFAVVAEPFVRVVFTDKWLPIVPYLQIFCLTYVFWPVHILNLQVITAVGRADIFLKLEIIKKVFIVVSVLCTYRFGVLSMAIAQAVISFLILFLHGYCNRKLISYSAFEQLKDILPAFAISAIMSIIVYFVGLVDFPNPYFQLIAQGATGVLAYTILCLVTRNSYFYEIINIVRHYMKLLTIKKV